VGNIPRVVEGVDDRPTSIVHEFSSIIEVNILRLKSIRSTKTAKVLDLNIKIRIYSPKNHRFRVILKQ
jgi:hypothetical protein